MIEDKNIVVNEISFSSNYEVTLYTDNVTVLLGKRTSYDLQINALEGILDALQGRSVTVDMRNYTEENKNAFFKEH